MRKNGLLETKNRFTWQFFTLSSIANSAKQHHYAQLN
jgi:hypothetical protein